MKTSLRANKNREEKTLLKKIEVKNFYEAFLLAVNTQFTVPC